MKKFLDLVIVACVGGLLIASKDMSVWRTVAACVVWTFTVVLTYRYFQGGDQDEQANS